MQFPTLSFASFFLPVLVLTWALRSHRTAQKLMLLIASYLFYAGVDVKLALLLGLSSAGTWVVGEALAGASGSARVNWQRLGVALNVLNLLFFKYYNWFAESMDALLAPMGLSSGLPVLEVLMPLAISFFTFQNISYLVDLGRGYGTRANTLLDYLLYISFFPQLLAGPICRSRDLLDQLHGEHPERIPDVSLAVSLLVSGLFKKVVLATLLGTHLVEDAFIAPENFGSFDLLVAAYGYTIQLYLDFSGYTDMARGLGLLLGFHLPDNFNGPYRATSIADFWRRWHITFSNWLRDYVYLPLGGSRRARPRVYLNLFLTLLVAGVWHGAHIRFAIWGAIHGVALVLNKMWLDRMRDQGLSPKTHRRPAWFYVLAWAYTFHLCVFARIVFRTPDLDVAWVFWKRLCTLQPGQGVEVALLFVIAIGLWLNFYGKQVREWFAQTHDRLPVAVRPVAWAGLGIAVLTLQPSDIAPYIYFQF